MSRARESPASRHGERSFTLPEALLASAIFTGVILVVSLSLINEAGRRVTHSGIRAGEAAGQSILDRIRADIQGSGSIVVPIDYDPFASWYAGPLTLTRHWSGKQITYLASGSTLVRIVADSEGPVETPIMEGVGTFHWSFVEGLSRRVVVVEIIRRPAAPFNTAGYDTDLAADRIVVSTRGANRTSW